MLDTVDTRVLLNEAFRLDVLEGLRRQPKQLPSRWLYDDAGSALFEDITRLPEYYPTRTETAILRTHAEAIAAHVGADAVLVEYGAGAGVKTRLVLDALPRPRAYVPVDIAGDFLAATAAQLAARYPALAVRPVVADFTEEFHLPADLPPGPRTAFFPGSTIGNLDLPQATALLQRMRRHVTAGPASGRAPGRAVIGFDLVKDLATLLRAYDDAAGVTAEFNLNLLRRIDRELDATLPLDAFTHEVRWNAAEHAVEMHLRCTRDLTAAVDGESVSFRAGETIHTESSRKYDADRIAALVQGAGWRLDHLWTDPGRQFAVAGLSSA